MRSADESTTGSASPTRSPSFAYSDPFRSTEPLEIDGEILRFAALQLGADPDAIRDYAERRQTISEHQRQIREYLRLRPFDASAAEDLTRFLEDEAQRLDRTSSLLARARGRLRDTQVLAPGEPVLRRAVGSARQALHPGSLECISARIWLVP